MKKTSLLRKYILERNALVCPGAHDVISAKLIEQSGFKALQVSGFGLSASYLGLPDMAFIGFSDVVHFTKNIVDTLSSGADSLTLADTNAEAANVLALQTRQQLSQSALSQHLARMRDEGLVAFRRESQTLWYRIADPRTEALLATLYQLYCQED